jgi:predicted nucleotidyltransferase
MKHPKFRVKSVLDLDKSVLDELEEVLVGVVKLIPYPLKDYVKDIEIVGSYANGCAGLHSDFDIAIPMVDWNAQMLLRRDLYGPNKELASGIRILCNEYEEKYQIKFDVNPVIPDNKENKTYATFSLYERKLYNKPAGLNKRWLKMMPYIQRYVLTDYELDGVPVDNMRETRVFASPKSFTVDDFTGEVAKWREIYGDKFIEYKTLPNGFLSE